MEEDPTPGISDELNTEFCDMESDYTTGGEAERCDASSVSEDPSTREVHETEYPHVEGTGLDHSMEDRKETRAIDTFLIWKDVAP